MPESGPYGSVRGAPSNERPYRDSTHPTIYYDRPMPVSGAERRSCCRLDRANRRGTFAARAFAHARRIFAGHCRRWRRPPRARRRPARPSWRQNRWCRRWRRRGLAVDRLRHREHAGRGEIENTMTVDPGRRDAERPQQRVVERLGLFQVVGADHDMRKHSSIPPHFFQTDSHDCCCAFARNNPARCPLPLNVDGTIGAAQAGDGQPQARRAAPIAGGLRFGNPAREGGFRRPARRLDAPRHLEVPPGYSYLWDASRGVPAVGGQGDDNELS